MGWDGNGNVIRDNGTNTGQTVWQDDADASVRIRADRHDNHDQDLADAIENAVALDGQNTTTTGNSILRFDSGSSSFSGVPVGTNEILARKSGNLIGVGVAASRLVGRKSTGDLGELTPAEGRTVLQVADAISPVSVTDGGTDAFTGDFGRDVSAGETVKGDFGSANTTTTPTLDNTGGTPAAQTITTKEGSALWPGALDGVHTFQLASGGGSWLVLDPINSRRVIDLSSFGVVADSDGTTGNGTDNTSALQAFASWLTGKGGYTITAPSGIIRFVAGNGGRQIFDLDGTNGVNFDLGDTELFDDATYDQPNDETGYIWHLNGCTDISVTIRKVTSEVITQGEAGLRTVFCQNACRRVSVYCEQEGGGRVLRAKQDLGDAESTRSSHLFVKATTTDVDEPVNFSYSGDQSEAWIINSGGGRPFFIANVRDVDVHMRTEDQSAAGILSCHGDGAGRTGSDNIRIHWDQLTGTSYPAALTLVDLRWVYSGTSAARARDIHFDFNIENPPAGTDAWEHVLRFDKTDSNGSRETTDRGHVAERITLQGSGNFPNGNKWTTEASGAAFSGSDRVVGLVMGPLAASSDHTLDLQFFENGDVQNPVTFNACRIASAFFENAAVFINCDASGTLSTNDATDHVYINCSIGDASSSDGNKTLINTDIDGLDFSRTKGSVVNIQGVKSGLAADSRLDNESINWGKDEANNLLEVKVKYSDGTVKTGSISLT